MEYVGTHDGNLIYVFIKILNEEKYEHLLDKL